MMQIRRTAVAVTATAALSLSGAALSTPATAAQQNGLVNVAIENSPILSQNNVGVGVAANIAAQVCGLTAQVGVISRQVARTGEFTCENAANDATATIDQAQ